MSNGASEQAQPRPDSGRLLWTSLGPPARGPAPGLPGRSDVCGTREPWRRAGRATHESLETGRTRVPEQVHLDVSPDGCVLGICLVSLFYRNGKENKKKKTRRVELCRCQYPPGHL